LTSPLHRPARTTAALIVLALAPLWLIGIFDRGLWGLSNLVFRPLYIQRATH